MKRICYWFAGENLGAFWFHAQAAYAWVLLLQKLRHTDERTSRSDSCHKTRDLSLHVPIYLWACVQIVCPHAWLIVELIHVKCPYLSSYLPCCLAGSIDILASHLTRYSIHLINKNNFCTKAFKHDSPLNRVALAHASNKWIAVQITHHSQSSAHIATGHFDNGLTLCQLTIMIGILNYLQRGPVFHAPTWLQEFTFCKQIAFAAVDILQLDQGGVVYQVKWGFDFH